MREKWKKYWQDADAQTRQTRLVALISVGILIGLTVLLTFTVGRQLVRFVETPQLFREWVQEQGFLGKLAYIGLIFIQIVVSIIPGEPFEFGGGYAFGAWQGLLLEEVGILLASSLIFIVVKKYGTRAVYAFFPKEKLDSFAFLHDSSRRNAIVFIIFLIPGTPKDILTYFVALTPMRLGEWLLITTVARIPSIISSTLAGAALGQSDVRSTIIIYAVTTVLSGIGLFFYRRFMKKKKED